MTAYRVLSPHLDDAALSCSLFLAAHPGSSIVTVFATGPASVSPLTPWDRAAKFFTDGADVTGIRRAEDTAAAGLVSATAVHLDYWDRQYRSPAYDYSGPAEADLARVISAELLARARPEAGPGAPAAPWVIPLGLGHPDHRLTTEVGLALAQAGGGPVCLYEDLPYAVEDAADVRDRLAYLAERGFTAKAAGDLGFREDRALKRSVIRCHASQRRSLRRRARAAVRARERVWALVPR